MDRIYKFLLEEHIAKYNQMIFISGPRQVGKTTLAQILDNSKYDIFYLNWDIKEQREIILEGQKKVFNSIFSQEISNKKQIVVFDEIHKYTNWKSFLKGFFDLYKNEVIIIVTGSAKLDVYKSGGDSLMGRYLSYRVHPLTIGEILLSNKPDLDKEMTKPKKIKQEDFENLIKFGGFPEPFLKKDIRFYNRWQNLRTQQFFKEDIRDLTKVNDVARMEILSKILMDMSAGLLNYSNLSNKLDVSVKTIQNWIDILCSMYFCFKLTPWSKNVSRSLLKEPKIFLWDWSKIKDKGQKLENFVASHLLKAVEFWTDAGFGEYNLYFLRDKDKREVDFLVTENNEPWFLVEVKASKDTKISSSLEYFHAMLKTKHAFQVVFDMEFVDKNCFEYSRPVKVPAQTFFSQLI